MVLVMAAVLALPGAAQSAMWVGGELGANWIGANSLRDKTDIHLIGGVTLGYDFVNSGFAGYNYPDWMKYFGIAMDYTYNNFNTVVGKGHVSAMTWLFYGHYGLFPDSEVPSGRLHPYVGVGPAIAWTTVDTDRIGTFGATNVALVAEGGLRFMALKNVSLDLAFRYRWLRPSFDVLPNHEVSTTVNSYSILTRVAYHF